MVHSARPLSRASSGRFSKSSAPAPRPARTPPTASPTTTRSGTTLHPTNPNKNTSATSTANVKRKRASSAADQHHRPSKQAKLDQGAGGALFFRKPTVSISPPKRRSAAIPTAPKLRKTPKSDAHVSFDEATVLHPPTRVTVAQPRGGLLQKTNGVQTRLSEEGLDVDNGGLAGTRSQGQTARTTRRDMAIESTDSGYMSATAAEPSSTAPRKALPTRVHPTAEFPAAEAPVEKKPENDKRRLRSKDGGSRLKSDLSIYFPNYDDVITDAPKTPEFLSLDTPIYIVDEQFKPPAPPSPKQRRASIASHHSGTRRPSFTNGTSTPSSPPVPQPKIIQINGAQSLDLSTLSRSSTLQSTPDPLPDSFYFAPHRRAERKEKQLRNIEKERAQHEKLQLERLLEGLQGPDWLRVMGISGVTDGERKSWEGKRSYFIREVKALVEKFRIWKEEEKRLREVRAKREREEQEEDDDDNDDEEEEEEDDLEDAVEGEDEECEDRDDLSSSELDASAARQLQEEAGVLSKPRPKQRNKQPPLPPPPPEPDKPLTSFFSKPHLRAAALGKQRHGRSVSAFGHPIPDVPEQDFRLPDEYVTPDALRESARKRRRMKRDRKSTK